MVTKPRDFHDMLDRSQEYGGSQASFSTVGVTSSLAVEALNYRRKITLVNDSANIIYLSKGTPAVANRGIRLNANGGAWVEQPDNLGYLFRGPWYAIATAAGSNLSWLQEY